MSVIKRNFVITLLSCSILLSFCCANIVWAETTKQTKVVASFYPMYIMARNVVKDVPGITVTNLTPPMTGCLHDYAITTNDMKKLVDADIFVANGAGMESFLNRILSQYPKVKIFQLAEGIQLIKGNGSEGDNPHLWVSVSYAIKEVKNLDADMEQADPAHAEFY